MTDEPWGIYGAYQTAAQAMLKALKAVQEHFDANMKAMRVVDDAIKLAEEAGITTGDRDD